MSLNAYILYTNQEITEKQQLVQLVLVRLLKKKMATIGANKDSEIYGKTCF